MLNLFKSLKFTKFVSLFTVLCFTVSNFTSNGFAASPAAVVAGAQNINASAALNPENFVIPFNIGRITDSVNFNTNRLIVQIQDLHAHEETQRNIASILSFLDAHYKINNIYVEGASGQVDTSWLADIKDESLKGSILNSLVSKGILTGSELFSITSGKTKILKGIEDKKTYLENFQRLITIDSKKEEIKELFPPLKEILAYLSDSIYSNENKKIDRVIKRYKDGKISFGKYFAYMLKKAKSQKVYFGFYPSIILLSQITDVQNKLDKNKINSQIESLMNDIKNNYSYGQYKELIEGSSSPETQGIFYFKLANFYNKSADKNKYKELGKFLQFINLNQEINPLDLVSEERSLIWEIKNNAAQTKKEKELIFLSSFLDIIEAFLDNKISYVEYKHIQRELPKFKKLWTKYTRMSEVPGLAQYFPLFKEFYKVNEDRNNIFIKEINGKIPQKSEEVLTFSKDMVMTNVSGLLQNAKEIDIVITGGFHTHDVSRILQNAHQSYLVITPNVTQGAAEADRLFTEDVMRKAQYMPANAFQKALLTAVASENFQQLTNSDDKTIIGIFFQKSIIDALVSKEAEEKGLDKEEVSKYLKDMEFLKGVLELADELKTAIKNKGITLELTDIKVTDKGEGYRITANGNEYIVSDKGVEDADQYNVKEANIYGIAGIITGAIVAATSVFGIVASVSIVAPVIAVLGLSVSILAGLGIFGFSAVSISNAKRVKDALEKTAQEELTDVKKERVAAYVNMLNIRYAGKLNTVEIQNEPGLKVIADADEANKIIRVNALALMKLDQDLVDNIILNHELVHIKGTKSEFITHLNNIFSFKSVKSYLFGKKSLVSSLLKFYSALDNYKACKNFDNKDKKAETMYVLIKSINILQVFIDRDVIKKYLSEDMPKVLEELESDGASELLKDYKTLDGDSEQDVKTNLEKYKEILEVYKVKEAADRKKEENEALAETEIEFDVNERKGSLKTQIAQAIENLIMVYKELFDAKSLESQVEDLRKIEVSKTEADFEEAVKKLGAIKFPIKNAAEAALINFKKAIEDYKKSPKEHFDKLLNTVDAVELISPENFGVKNKLVSILKSRLSDYKEAVKKYHGNNTGQNHKVMETAENNALEAIKAYIDERMKILEGPVEQVCKIIEKLYGISPEEEIQQVAMILKYIRMKKEGEPDVEKFLTDDTLVNVQEQSKNYPKNIINFSEIIKWKKENGKKTDIPIVFNLALAGIGENLKRTEFLKAWYVLQVRERKVEKKEMEAKSDVEREEAKAERKKISEAVESMYFLQAEWYNEREYGQEDITYEDLVKMGADKIEESYGLVLDIMTQDKNEQLKAGDPQLKTKALDIGLRVQERNGYWTIKSVAEIILDDFIAKKNAGFAGLTLNLVTNNESLEDVKKLLKRISSTGKTYEEELINLGVLKKVYGKGYEGYTDTDGLSIDGLYLQKTHPTIQYDEKTGEMNFFYHQELINHGSFLAKLVRQMVESGDEEDTFWYFGNSDNFLAGQFPLEVFDWMDDTKTPAVIVVTEKGTSEGNKKGGIPMIIRTAASALGTPVPIFKIIEIAQVKQDKELEAEFQAAEKAFFNTNIIILKKLEIISAIKKLKDALEKQEVVDIISGTYPDLKDKETIIKYLYVLGDTIVNDKSTNKKEKYVKLEIAIASSLMELSNLVSLATGETLLKFVYFTDKETQEMFGPIKKEENFYETLEERVVIESIKSSVIKKIVEFIFGIINRFLSTHIAIDPYVSQKIVKTTSAVIKGITNKIFENLYIHTDFAKYHELIGLEDVLIYDGEGTDEEFAIKTAVKKAALGKNVNVIMPLDTNTDITEMSAENTGDSHIYKKTLAQGNGFKVNVYYYVNDKEPAAYNAYKYVVDNLDGAVGIVENGSNISYSAITETSPLAAVFAITLNTEQNDQAKEKGYLHFTNNLSESEKLEIAGKEIKGKRDGNDMRNQVALAAAIDVLEISQDIFDSAEYNNFTTFIVEVNVSGYEARKAQLKNFIAAGHAKDKNIVLRFKAGDLQQAKEAVQIVENDLRSLRANLSKKDIKRLEISAAEYAKADSRGIDGIIFDFNALSKDEVDNALTGTSKISSAIIRENVDGIAVVETNYYSNKFREGNIKNFSDLAAEIGPKNGTLFNESTVDVNAVAKDVENAMESDKGMIIIRSEIIKALKKNNINFDFNAFLLRIVTIWVLVVKKTPEGRFRAGKRAGLAVDIDTQIDEKGIYEILRQMRSASSEQYSEIVENMAKKLENTKTRQLASLIKQTPDQEQNLVFQEALGYLQGVLERLEANKHMKEVNFAVRIDTDIYRSMLVEARMYELLDGINVPERKDQSYASADDELQRADYIVYKDTAQTREEMREVINILTSFVENAKPDNPDRSIALAKLLELLNVYSKEVKVSNDYTKNTITNEGVRAMLSAA